ncbi:hypothetical protein LCGC14_1161440 [marine sediment metagenome]|uniref:Uncharacterized protein n=1 Tax=marine sediment metagenome TaxID=412755 RepID=A0A0F9MFG8_9ZZZZ
MISKILEITLIQFKNLKVNLKILQSDCRLSGPWFIVEIIPI